MPHADNFDNLEDGIIGNDKINVGAELLTLVNTTNPTPKQRLLLIDFILEYKPANQSSYLSHRAKDYLYCLLLTIDVLLAPNSDLATKNQATQQQIKLLSAIRRNFGIDKNNIEYAKNTPMDELAYLISLTALMIQDPSLDLDVIAQHDRLRLYNTTQSQLSEEFNQFCRQYCKPVTLSSPALASVLSFMKLKNQWISNGAFNQVTDDEWQLPLTISDIPVSTKTFESVNNNPYKRAILRFQGIPLVRPTHQQYLNASLEDLNPRQRAEQAKVNARLKEAFECVDTNANFLGVMDDLNRLKQTLLTHKFKVGFFGGKTIHPSYDDKKIKIASGAKQIIDLINTLTPENQYTIHESVKAILTKKNKRGKVRRWFTRTNKGTTELYAASIAKLSA